MVLPLAIVGIVVVVGIGLFLVSGGVPTLPTQTPFQPTQSTPPPTTPPTTQKTKVIGYVTDSAGNALSGAIIHLGGLSGLLATTDSEGYYEFEVASEDRDFEMIFEKTGYITITTTVHATAKQTVQKDVQMSSVQVTTFIVTVPLNTPDYSVIYMEWFYREGGYWSNINNMIEMTKVSPTTWKAELVLTPTDYGADGVYFYYRYSRDRWGYPAAEEFTPDAENACRKILIAESAGKTVRDSVAKWRWFPSPDETPIPLPTSSAKTAEIRSRINGENFFRGMALQDFWNGEIYDVLIEPTLAALKGDSVNAVGLGAPGWGYEQVDPILVISESPYYPLEDLEHQLGKLKQHGFKVLMSAQFGPIWENPASYDPYTRDHSQEWWESWYAEIERVSIYAAELAENYDVEMLVPFGGLLGAWGKAPDAEARFSRLIDNMRQHYSGKIGIPMALGFKPPTWQEAIPLPSDIPAFEKYDFVYLVLVAALSTEQSPTQEELNATARTLFEEKIKPLYTVYGKPVVLTPQYSSYQGVLQDTGRFGEEETSLWCPYNPEAVFNGVEQAMAFEAVMNAVAQAEYIVGVYPFAYPAEEFPRSVEVCLREKPAERIIAGWYERFAEEGK